MVYRKDSGGNAKNRVNPLLDYAPTSTQLSACNYLASLSTVNAAANARDTRFARGAHCFGLDSTWSWRYEGCLIRSQLLQTHCGFQYCYVSAFQGAAVLCAWWERGMPISARHERRMSPWAWHYRLQLQWQRARGCDRQGMRSRSVGYSE